MGDLIGVALLNRQIITTTLIWLLHKLRPNSLPVVRTQRLPRNNAAGLSPNVNTALWRDRRLAVGHLREIRRRDAETTRQGHGPSAFGCDVSFEVHSFSLVNTKSNVK